MASLNILVLGQSGTGKSTWINSIANYLSYQNLQEALEVNRPVCLIPSQFTLMNDEYHEIKVSIGTADENEGGGGDTGESCTKKPRVYSFKNAEQTLNFIDVPGIGDTAGTEQDEANTKMILEALTSFSELHAICILLKSSDTRITPEYKYCLSELLIHLHKNALSNVVFVFTHSRGADYKPGDALAPLNAYLNGLKQSKGIEVQLNRDASFDFVIYCIDNEAFRYLAARHCHPTEFRDVDPTPFIKSWDQSRDSTSRLINRIKQLRAHEVIETLSINEARSMILLLLQPLATITALIQTNTANYINNFDEIVNQLQQNLNVSEFDLEIEELQRPRTVCTHKECIATEKLSGNNRYTTYYKSICHDACYLKNVKISTFPEPALEYCEAIDYQTRNCIGCKHSVTVHMHIDYNQKKITKNSYLSEAFKRVGGQPTKAMAEKELKEMLEKLENEQKVLTKTLVEFGCFLKRNAILEYNGDIEERLKVEIRKEETIARNTGNQEAVGRLQKIIEDYRSQQKSLQAVINTVINSGNDQSVLLKPQDIIRLRNDLFHLPLHGEKIEQLYKKASGEDDGMKNTLKNQNVVHFSKFTI
uniref:G domain-containing protein n=1 Tax=Panagrolaimus sp. ES5 TaxID=591445 RepID=A0AC34G2S5_9BILA